ncbi:MAG: hypothetical protein WDN08_12085 [Rhizomicrobium sp.]
MTILAYSLLALIAVVAGAFVAWPILRQRTARGRFVLARRRCCSCWASAARSISRSAIPSSRRATWKATRPRT